MSDEQLSVAVLQRVTEFLQSLPAPELAAIADGRAKLTHVPTDDPPGPAQQAGPTPPTSAPAHKATMITTAAASPPPAPATKMTTAAAPGATAPLKSGATAVKAMSSAVSSGVTTAVSSAVTTAVSNALHNGARAGSGATRPVTATVDPSPALPRHAVPAHPTRPVKQHSVEPRPTPAGTVAPAEAAAALNRLASRDEGELYLSTLACKDLKALAAHLDMRGLSNLRKADLIDKIINRTIGYRLSFTSIRHL